MICENEITISISIYKGQRANLKFPVSSTVEDLKLEIHKRFNIRPSKQIIHGWSQAPENDDSTLEFCTVQERVLVVVNSEHKMESQDIVTFFLVYEGLDRIVQLLKHATVETLKCAIHQLFELPPHEQMIDGWKRSPNSESTLLHECVDVDITYLTITRKSATSSATSDNNFNVNVTEDEDIETGASWSFITKFLNKAGNCSNRFLPQSCTLQEAIIQACLTLLEERRVLILYLHKENDAFSSVFCESLRKPEVLDIVDRNVFFLGWDIDQPKYQSALKRALCNCGDLANVAETITFQFGLALCIVPVNGTLKVFSCLKGNMSYKDVLLALKEAESCLINEKEQEIRLGELKQEKGHANDFGSQQYQQLMANMLGDRDYDIFEFNQLEQLKDKIAYALLGPPETADGYASKHERHINSIYRKILTNSNVISKYKDTVEISFIYNCTEPLPGEKLARAKKMADYNPNTDINPRPIFVLRKCHGSADPCRVFVDDIGRTYETWQQYLARNKLDECEMVLPVNGRYQFDNNGEVRLERHLSPACGIDVKVLQYADYVSTAGGLISGAVFVAAVIPSITVAPVALMTAGAVGVGVGIYSIGRSAYALYDRQAHRENMSFANSEARGAYVNIIAGSLGFVGAGATMAVSQLAARGVNIGQGAAAAVDAIAFINIGVGGASVLNSGYDVFDQWYNENQTPSLLTIVQLSSSVLFFGNAVYNFRTCNTIVRETQAKMLQDYQESLRSNRHRKTFTKLMKETIRQNNGNEVQGRAEVIKVIRNVQNKDEVFAVLTRSKKTMNQNGIKFAAVDGEIRLNGVRIDMNEFTSMNHRDASAFLSNLSSANTTPAESVTMQNVIVSAFQDISLPGIQQALPDVTMFVLKMLGSCSMDVKSKVITAVADLLGELTEPIIATLNNLFPGGTKYFKIVETTVRFFAKVAEKFEEQYEEWKRTGDDQYYNPLFSVVDVSKMKIATNIFEIIVNSFFCGKSFRKQALESLLKYFYNWFAIQMHDFQERRDRDDRRRENSANLRILKNPCSKCGGYYYTHTPQ